MLVLKVKQAQHSAAVLLLQQVLRVGMHTGQHYASMLRPSCNRVPRLVY